MKRQTVVVYGIEEDDKKRGTQFIVILMMIRPIVTQGGSGGLLHANISRLGPI